MLVALTGASGFIGSFTAHALKRQGHQTRALVRSTSRRDHIAGAVSDFITGDFDDPQAIEKLIAGADAVIHNAADWDVLKHSPQRNFEKNVLGSLRLLESARLAGVKQFIFVSSVAVHHEILPGGRIDENHPTWPHSIYGAYKAAIEPHLKAYHYSYGMNTSAWRPAAVYGIDPVLKRSNWFELIETAVQGGNISTDKGGKITHVQDVADALAYAVGDDSTGNQFYNLVDRHIYWQEAAEIAKELASSNAAIENRKGTGPKNQFDCAKATAFFDRHRNNVALRRGLNGVRGYVADLLQKLK
jgi:nucleoside-diphosphate-sugar epimerase